MGPAWSTETHKKLQPQAGRQGEDHRITIDRDLVKVGDGCGIMISDQTNGK